MENTPMLALAYAFTIMSALLGVVVIARSVARKEAIPLAMGAVYFASAVAVLGAISA